MGSISSVYVGADYRGSNESNSENAEARVTQRQRWREDDPTPVHPMIPMRKENDFLKRNFTHELEQEENVDSMDVDNAVSLTGSKDIQNICQNVLRVEMNHSLRLADDRLETPESRREHLGITVQYLAEENVRLALTNKKLRDEMERLRGEVEAAATENEDRDAIYGESIERRLSRLQRHLASERQEKWSAIENGERTRVDLVNCEKELAKSNETVEKLKQELEAKKALLGSLEASTGSSKERDESDDSMEQKERQRAMAEFRSDLKIKRETRQRALSAISSELNALRGELQREKSQRQRLQDELDFLKENATDPSARQILNDNATLKNEISILTENVERLKDFSAENIRLKCEIQKRNEEMDSLNSSLGELKFEYYEEKRKHERTQKRLKEMEETGGKVGCREDWEKEKEKLFERYDREKEEINKRTNALKEVIAITKQMLAIREAEVEEMKKKLKDIEESVKNSRIMQEDGLKAEYEKQLENIKNLKELYEERVRLMEAERQKLQESLQEKSDTIKRQENEIENLNKEVESSRAETSAEKQDKECMERELRLTIARTKDLENEISLTNNLFTQMLLGPYNSGNETDLDKLTELLQENHDLIAEMTTREESSEIASVLPKLLLDLITQVDGVNDKKDDDGLESCDTISEQSEGLLEENQGAVLPILSYKNATLFKPAVVQELKNDGSKPSEGPRISEHVSPAVQEIASNLPKVWRVLMELLSHHTLPEEPTPGDEKQCYKNVETPNGPRTVISVSKTFIRLKDLILEKKSLQKELTRLKQLNSHLETRLDDQEKRLSQVQCELHKTWGIVGRMRAQHQQLHNNEKILRFELQEKRVMLSELKQELEYCRDKWERARQKNDESETEWKKLRREFAARKSKGYSLTSLNDSGESGYSDEQNESGEDCENFDADRSSTQSPVDNKLMEAAAEGLVSASPDANRKDLSEEISKQSENNLKQTSQNVEQTRLEECSEVQPTTSKATRVVQDERERAREARDLRLKRLEEQCKLLVRQVDITTHKSNYLSSRLEELHEQYGSADDRGQSTPSLDSASSSQPRQDGASGQRDCDEVNSDGDKVQSTPKDNQDN